LRDCCGPKHEGANGSSIPQARVRALRDTSSLFDAVPLWLTPFCGSVPVRIATVEQAEISKAKKSQTRPMVSECCLVHRALLSADLVTVEDEVKDTGDRAGNIDHGPCFRKIANDAPNGSAGRPNYSSSFQRFCSRRRSAIPDQFPAISIAPSSTGAVLVVVSIFMIPWRPRGIVIPVTKKLSLMPESSLPKKLAGQIHPTVA